MSTWEEKAFNTHKLYYTHFGGCQWSEFDIPGSRRLLRAKICYALFGPPKKNEDNIEDLYEPEQQKRAEEIIDKLLTVKPFRHEKLSRFLNHFMTVKCFIVITIKCDKNQSRIFVHCLQTKKRRVHNSNIQGVL